MNEPGKSDKPVVPAKPANTSPSMSFWELFEQVQQVEGRGLAKENGEDAQGVFPSVDPAKQVERTQSREREGPTFPQDLHSALDRVRQAACRDKGLKFTALWHHVCDVERLREAYLALKPDAAAGIDGQTWQAYGKELQSNLQNLSDRLARGAYRAKPVKRVYIPKADGKQRPIGIPVLDSGSSGTVARRREGAQCHLRIRLPRLLIWVSTRAQRSRGIGCPGGWNSNKEGELVARR